MARVRTAPKFKPPARAMDPLAALLLGRLEKPVPPAEVRRWKDEARRRAVDLGHELSAFQQEGERQQWLARCTRGDCFAAALVSPTRAGKPHHTKPGVIYDGVGGPAITTRCSSADAAPRPTRGAAMTIDENTGRRVAAPRRERGRTVGQAMHAGLDAVTGNWWTQVGAIADAVAKEFPDTKFATDLKTRARNAAWYANQWRNAKGLPPPPRGKKEVQCQAGPAKTATKSPAGRTPATTKSSSPSPAKTSPVPSRGTSRKPKRDKASKPVAKKGKKAQ